MSSAIDQLARARRVPVLMHWPGKMHHDQFELVHRMSSKTAPR